MMNTFSEAIQSATAELLEDKRVHVIGLGASYKNGLDGTMGDLAERYPEQVHDVPCSENAITGTAVGMATAGLLPLVHHGRIEFSFHAFDQIFNQAAKWSYMFGGNYQCALTARIAMGRQWGNGPQHTFTAKGIFAIPGLKVAAPSSPNAAKNLLLAAVRDPNPVIYLESRWLYKTKETVIDTEMPLDKARVLRTGKDVTIVAVADMVIDALKAARLLANIGVEAEVIDVVSVYPLDIATMRDSVSKTGHLVTVDASTPSYSIAHEIIAELGTGVALTCPDTPCPTAPSLAAKYYPTAARIASVTLRSLGRELTFDENYTFEELNLPPTDNFDTQLLK